MINFLLPWLICLTAALFPFYSFFQMNMMNSFGTELAQAYSLTSTQFGILSAIFFYTNALFLLPAGICLDRYETRTLILLAMLFSTSGAFIIATSHVLPLIAIARFFAGLGHSFAILSCFCLVVQWFQPRQRAYVMGIVTTIALLGGVMAQTPFTLLLNHISWKNVLLIDGGMGLIITLIIWKCLETHTLNNPLRSKQGFSRINLVEIIKSPQNWYCAIYSCTLSLPLFLFGAVWGNQYLTSVFKLSAIDASVVSSMIFIGMIIGSPLLGWFSDRIQRRKPLMLVSAFFLLPVMVVLIVATQLTVMMLLILFFLMGLFSSAQIIGYPTITENNSSVVAGAALSFISVGIMLGGAISQTLFGWTLEKSHDNFLLPLLILIVAFFISFLSAFLIRETYCKAIS